MNAPTLQRYSSTIKLIAQLVLSTVISALLCVPGWSEEVLPVSDFEDVRSISDWEFRSGTPRLVTEGVSHGRSALEVKFDPKGQYYGAYMYWRKVHRDWSAYDALVLDVFNPNPEPVSGYLLVGDEAWAGKGRSYWNRHNRHITFAGGLTRWTIPVHGLYRGEAGSRNNDIKRNIDPDSVVRVDFGFGQKGGTGRIIIDNLRLVKAPKPTGVWALDFGPPNQSVMLGWTPVSHQTHYTPERGFGWGPRGGSPWNGAARDTTFGTMLLEDFCEAGGYNFRIDVPAGKYKVVVFYENSGYWGGEQAMHRERRILVNGQLAWKELRRDGPAHSLYRFEEVEPVGVDVWDTYMEDELARPAAFEADADKTGISLRFEADRAWGSKVAAIALHRLGDQAGSAWLTQQMQALADEFRSRAVCLDAPAPPFEVPASWAKLGLVAWQVPIEDEVTPNSLPVAELKMPTQLELSRLAVRGEYEPFCLAVRPMRNLGECELTLEPFTGPGHLVAQLQVVRYGIKRGFNSIAYRILPHTLRRQSRLNFPADITRELIVTVRVPDDAPAGEYRLALVIKSSTDAVLLRVPLKLSVRNVTLNRDTDFLMGFFGLMPPRPVPEESRWQVLEETLVMLRQHGMNAVSGGPSWRLTGWRNGKPVIDFGEVDRFFRLLRKHGFTKPLNGYGGARFLGLHERYQKGSTGTKVERESGLPYETAVLRAWQQVDEHARQGDWPTILYGMCDETRVREVAEREIEFMRIMAKVSAAYPETVRTSGSYSVSFISRPTDRNNLLYWHQRFFETLDISSLNRHDESVITEARRLGKDIHIYNQGRDRYTFGLYQWSEHRKGIRARWQWHLNILHGYQFFDLDGREPDNSMICYGRYGIYPTIQFERCREGAEDFYLYNTLWKLTQKLHQQANRSPALDAALTSAERLLEDATSKVKLNDRRQPVWFHPDQFKAKVIEAIEKLAEVKGR